MNRVSRNNINKLSKENEEEIILWARFLYSVYKGKKQERKLNKVD
jgi:hypothetical protein